MAGDPCQLPPVISSPAAVTPALSKNGGFPVRPEAHSVLALPGVKAAVNQDGPSLQGLARPLLVRLIQQGHTAHLLRRQYR